MFNTANISKHLTPTKINELDLVLYYNKNYWLYRIPFLQETVKILPTEIWEIILIKVMHLEKRGDICYLNYIYSEENRKPMFGMTLRNRQIRIPNLHGRLMNDSNYVIDNGNIYSKEISEKLKEKLLISFSKLFLNYIIKWFHWISESKFYNLKKSLELKTKDLFEQCHTRNISNPKIVSNFRLANYFTQTYYPNVMFNKRTHFDYDFETFIFYNKYYRNVYEKSIMLRNGKRINMFLHEQ